jgi:hypothetical protein
MVPSKSKPVPMGEGSLKSDTPSPLMSLEAVLITSTINAFEGRNVVIVDMPGAFLKVGVEEEVYMCTMGRLVELMVQTAPEIYRTYVTVGSNNTPALYVKLQKVLYGCLRSALLFYLKLVENLESDGFEIDPYDPCLAKNIANEKQFTIMRHVDDLKLSHINEDEVTQKIE